MRGALSLYHEWGEALLTRTKTHSVHVLLGRLGVLPVLVLHFVFLQVTYAERGLAALPRVRVVLLLVQGGPLPRPLLAPWAEWRSRLGYGTARTATLLLLMVRFMLTISAGFVICQEKEKQDEVFLQMFQ